jgi:hypothetical protein
MLRRHRGEAKCLAVFLFGCWMLFGSQLWSQNRREYIYMNGKLVTTESQQLSPMCVYALNPTSILIPVGGGSSSVNVGVGAGCGWASVSNDPSWITITSGTSGSGNGVVNFSVPANTGTMRTGTLTIAGQTVTVKQCAYDISPTSSTIGYSAGGGSFSVNCYFGCNWTATSSDISWLTVNSGSSSGSNPGSILYSATANTGPSRNAVITAGGKQFTLYQDAAQQPASLSFSSASGFAGVSSYTTTVGNGANMTANVEYTFTPRGSSTPQTMNGTVGPLDASGQMTRSIALSEAQGTYVYTRIKNTLRSDWITLSSQPQFTIRPPKPNPVTFSGDNSGGILTVGNGASMTVEFLATSNLWYIGTFENFTFQITLNANGRTYLGPGCAPFGGWMSITSMHNILDSGEGAWVPLSIYFQIPGCPY